MESDDDNERPHIRAPTPDSDDDGPSWSSIHPAVTSRVTPPKKPESKRSTARLQTLVQMSDTEDSKSGFTDTTQAFVIGSETGSGSSSGGGIGLGLQPDPVDVGASGSGSGSGSGGDQVQDSATAHDASHPNGNPANAASDTDIRIASPPTLRRSSSLQLDDEAERREKEEAAEAKRIQDRYIARVTKMQTSIDQESKVEMFMERIPMVDVAAMRQRNAMKNGDSRRGKKRKRSRANNGDDDDAGTFTRDAHIIGHREQTARRKRQRDYMRMSEFKEGDDGEQPQRSFAGRGGRGDRRSRQRPIEHDEDEDDDDNDGDGDRDGSDGGDAAIVRDHAARKRAREKAVARRTRGGGGEGGDSDDDGDHAGLVAGEDDGDEDG